MTSLTRGWGVETGGETARHLRSVLCAVLNGRRTGVKDYR